MSNRKAKIAQAESDRDSHEHNHEAALELLEEAREELKDWRDSAKAAAAEDCGIEKHCTCVGPLRAKLAEAERERDEGRKAKTRLRALIKRSGGEHLDCKHILGVVAQIESIVEDGEGFRLAQRIDKRRQEERARAERAEALLREIRKRNRSADWNSCPDCDFRNKCSKDVGCLSMERGQHNEVSKWIDAHLAAAPAGECAKCKSCDGTGSLYAVDAGPCRECNGTGRDQDAQPREGSE